MSSQIAYVVGTTLTSAHMPPLILLAIYGLSTPKTANGTPYACRSWASTYASIESVLESFPMPRAKSRTCRGFTTATGRPAAPSSATSAASRPPVASMTITKGVRFWSRLTRPSILFASVVHVNDVSSGSTWTSNFSWLTSIPTKISLGTCDIPHLWIRTPMGPGDCSGFIHEDIRRSSCWTLSNKPVPIDQPGLPSRSLQGTGQPCTPPITGCTRRSNPEYSLPKKYRLPDPYCQSSPQADVRGRGGGSSSNNIQVPPDTESVISSGTCYMRLSCDCRPLGLHQRPRRGGSWLSQACGPIDRVPSCSLSETHPTLSRRDERVSRLEAELPLEGKNQIGAASDNPEKSLLIHQSRIISAYTGNGED